MADIFIFFKIIKWILFAQVLYTSSEKQSIIQASVNSNSSLLGKWFLIRLLLRIVTLEININ